MKSLTTRMKSVLTVGVVVAAVASAAPVQAAVTAQGKTYTVTATMKGAKNLTVLMVSGSGQLLASKKITKTSQAVTLKAKSTASIGGTTLQLVASSSSATAGKYYGPVVLGNKSATAAKSSIVYTKFKQKAATKVKLGTVTVKKVKGTTQQGYATTSKKSSAADTSKSASVKATKGKPLGVGTYGKTGNTSVKSYGVSAFACPPAGTDICDSQGNVISGPQGPANPGQVGPPPNSSGQTGSGTPAVVDKDDTLGGDKDDDGIPNAFDVNDDGDDVLDSADQSTPAPKVAVDNGTTTCGAVDFRIFTNYKATRPGYGGTINAYGPGPFKATTDNIASTISRSMSMVFSPIATVCGSNVTKTYLKGVGVPYAPSEYVELTGKCNTGDYQWLIGKGRMCGTDASGYAFGTAQDFKTSLPTGQDTFSMKVETADGKSYEFSSSAGFVFVTHPMFVSYSTDGATYTKIDYSNSIPAPDGASITEPTISVTQNQTLYLQVLRPQRLAIDGEIKGFYNLGGFKFTPDVPNIANLGKCDELTTTDTTMASDTLVDDTKPDTIVLQWAIGQKCFTESTKTPRPTWTAGPSDFDIQVEPSGPGGNSAQKIRITLA